MTRGLLKSLMDGLLRAQGLAPLYKDRPRMTIHTANHSFTGKIDIDQKKGLTLVSIATDDGRDVGVPYGSIEYFEQLGDDE